jgi:SAM-dependent methyltransferase
LSPSECPVCGGPTRPWVLGLQSATAGRTVDTYECDRCRSAFAWPLDVPAGLYEQVYAEKGTPGYRRYREFAGLVGAGKWSLPDLARQQDVYWAVEQTVQDLPAEATIIEVGSGLGYVTGALRASGRRAFGIDLSREAVAEARERIGPWFSTVSDASEESPSSGADLVISLETIEHVVDPLAFVKALVERARPGGKVLVTTPNRDPLPGSIEWWSDLPPVHLYWFGEASLRSMASAVGCDVSFLDFTAYHERHHASVPDGTRKVLPMPILGVHGTPRHLGNLKAQVAKSTRRFPELDRNLRNAVRKLRRHRLPLRERSGSLAAVLTTPQ